MSEPEGHAAHHSRIPRSDGVWSIEIGDGRTYLPAGVLVLEDGHVRGGDSGYLYFGNYRIDGPHVTIAVNAKHYRDQRPNVWGADRESFSLEFCGRFAEAEPGITGDTRRPDTGQRWVTRLLKRSGLPS